jgi:hypothetical protein
MDFGYSEYHHRGVDTIDPRAVPEWLSSDIYSDLEHAVTDYAGAATATPERRPA